MQAEHEHMLTNEWKNSIEYKPVIYDLAEDLMYFCIFYPVLMLIGHFLVSGIMLYIRWFILLAAMIAMTINRRKSKKVFIFALVLVGITAFVALIPSNLPVKLEMMSIMLISAISSVKKLSDDLKRADYKNDPSIDINDKFFLNAATIIAGTILIYVTYMVSLAIHENGMLYTCLAASAVLFACFGVYIHKTGTYSLIEWNKSSTYATQKIKKINLLFCCFGAAVVGVIGFLTYCIVYFTGLGSMDERIIGFFTQASHFTVTIQKPQASETSQPDNSLKMLNQVKGQPNILFQILSKVMTVIFWAVCAVVVIIAIYMLIRLIFSLLKKFQYGINEETRTVFSMRETANEVAEKIKKSRVIALFSGTSNSMKIRKLYYKLIKKYKTRGVEISNTDSPDEIGFKIEKDAGSNINAETLIYEKARYGFKDCEKKDVDNLKSSFKK